MQLVAYGAQDIYLTGNPMITYFKVVYRRHTNFAMESILQTFSGTVGYGKKVTALISRNGDLVNGMLLQITIPAEAAGGVGFTRYIRNLGHVLVKQVEVEIGGQLIDRHYSDWLEIWSQLTVTASKIVGYRNMIGQALLTNGGVFTQLQELAVAVRTDATTIYVPLQFWFCRNVGLALPLIALQYHEVKVNITFANKASVVTGANAQDIKAELWVDYIYLDTDERRRFAQVSHEYLIEQLQFTGDEAVAVVAAGTSKSLTLNFNHPVKELVWVYNNTANMQAGSYVNSVAAGVGNGPNGAGAGADIPGADNFAFYSENSINPVQSAKLLLNGHDRFAERDGQYFNRVQPNAHHTCIPGDGGINVYSFALKPEDHQPSGTCNFSRIDNAKLNLKFNTIANAGVIKVFATNYNVLRIMSGMGGLAYSN